MDDRRRIRMHASTPCCTVEALTSIPEDAVEWARAVCRDQCSCLLRRLGDEIVVSQLLMFSRMLLRCDVGRSRAQSGRRAPGRVRGAQALSLLSRSIASNTPARFYTTTRWSSIWYTQSVSRVYRKRGRPPAEGIVAEDIFESHRCVWTDERREDRVLWRPRLVEKL